jgi:PAS domain S-box-containing protein
LRDDRIAGLALQAPPVWLWRADLTGLLWANAAGAACLRASTLSVLAAQRFSQSEPRLAQLARIAGTLYPGGAPRLARLRGLVPVIGRAVLCTVSRIVVNNDPAILVAAQESAADDLPLADRLGFLLAGASEAMAAFTPDGRLVAATPSGRAMIGRADAASAIGADALVTAALADGAAAGDIPLGRASIIRVGGDAVTALLAVFQAAPHEAADAEAEIWPPAAPAAAGHAIEPLPLRIGAPLSDRRIPLRFVWQMDQHGCFTLGSDEFIETVGSRTAVELGRPWREIAAELDLDPENAVLRAIETRETWSGIVVSFPIDGSSDRVRVELSGLPIYDREHVFLGYRGFGVCRDVERHSQFGWVRRAPSVGSGAATLIAPCAVEPGPPAAGLLDDADAILTLLHRTDGALSIGPELEWVEEKPAGEQAPAESVQPENILMFPAATTDGKSRAAAPIAAGPAALSLGEHDAFQEIARRLQARLASDAPSGPGAAQGAASDAPIIAEDRGLSAEEVAEFPTLPGGSDTFSLPPFLDALPVGLLVYRQGQPLYANRAFLAATGFSRLADLAEAGGLDGLPDGIDVAIGLGPVAPLVTIIGRGGTTAPIAARLIAVPWGGKSALALVLLHQADASDQIEVASLALHRSEAQLGELRAIIDTAFEGLIVLSRDGFIVSVNRRAEVLFGQAPAALVRRPFADLFAPESRRAALDYLDKVRRRESFIASGHELTGQTRHGRAIPLSVNLAEMPGDGDTFCAVFRDLTPHKKAEADLLAQRRDAERAVADHADLLERLSSSVRGALASITGFVDLMLEERHGPLGNERYRGCLRELRAAADHINGLVDNTDGLSRAESETHDLDFVPVDFNGLVQGCIKTLQVEANRDRIIIRSALSPRLRPVLADAQSLQRIVSNLLANAIRHAGAGGQVIVSTTETERGHVVFRVRDTGASGLKSPDLPASAQKATASAPDYSRGASVDMVLTRTLAEANRGTLHISSKADEGTLFEVSFPGARIPAE